MPAVATLYLTFTFSAQSLPPFANAQVSMTRSARGYGNTTKMIPAREYGPKAKDTQMEYANSNATKAQSPITTASALAKAISARRILSRFQEP